MIKDLRDKLIVLSDALEGVIDVLNTYIEEDTPIVKEDVPELEEYHYPPYVNADDIPDTPMYEPDNVFQDEDSFRVVTACNPEIGDEFDYYVTPYHELVVNTNGGHDNITYSTTQTVDIPVGYAVKKCYHKFEDGNLVVIVPKKRNIEFPFTKKRRPTDFNYLHQKRDKKGRFICMR